MAEGVRFMDLPVETELDETDGIPVGSNGTSALKRTTLAALRNWLFGGNALDRYYPVGSIYMTTANTNPAVQFGGTWERLTDRMLVGASETYPVNSTGGAATVTLKTEEIPSHSHSGPSHSHSVPAHSHGMTHSHSIPSLTGTANTAGSEHEHCGHYNTDGGSGSKNRYLPSGKNNSTTPLTLKDGAHAHTVKTNASTTGGASTANTGNSVQFNTGASGTGATGAAGGGKSHNNMPPYLAVYMWRRTA